MSNRTRATRPKAAPPLAVAPNGDAPEPEVDPEPEEIVAEPDPDPPMQQIQIPGMTANQAAMEIMIELKQNGDRRLKEYQVATSQVLKELITISEAAIGLATQPINKTKPQVARLKLRLDQVKQRLIQSQM